MPGREPFAAQPDPACDIVSNFRAILDTIADGVIVIDEAGTMHWFNPAAERLFGYHRDEVMGRNVSLLMPEPDHSRHDGYLADYLRTGIKKIIGVGREVQGRRKDGSLFPMYLSIGEQRQGDQRLFVGIVHDLTRRKQAEAAQRRDHEALRESEARFSQVADMVGEWLWEQDAAGRYVYCSNAVESILGYRPGDVLGRSYLDLMTFEDRRHWSEGVPPQGRDARPFQRLVNRYRHRDGHEVFTESTGMPIFDEAGRLLRWRGVDLDITAHKRFEDALRLRERAIEAASVGIAIADARRDDYPNLYVNPALVRITGYAREELLGQGMAMLQGPGTDPESRAAIRSALRGGGVYEGVLLNYRKDGTPFWNELLLSPVRDEAGAVTHYIGVQTDVTERRRAEAERQELEIAKQIQLSLLPKAPLRLPGAEIAGMCVPATHVGGDYFDYFSHDGRVDLVIADVSGHSVGAALIMTELRSTLKAELRRAHEDRAAPGPAALLGAVNAALFEDLQGAELFITLFYLRYELATRRLRFANAGHNRVLLRRRAVAGCVELDADGLILGVKREPGFEESGLVLEPGDCLLLYTDGVVESRNEQGEFFGVGRLCRWIGAYGDMAPGQMVRSLLEELRGFCGKAAFEDDISMVAMRVM
ncbi:PAS domain S-box-containing protein [Methylomagnum ishizawai]|uniref:Sensor protein FixL n=1 Tax=Methylomagnum ishizawai TaxID=1760988 RepID=A0A1Y6CTR4_9GAMM|nr:PAS domain S-box protein [Methylomagnum ishizawai]SMF94039.1 PAS domain S-box-containing protein [Methylomagnum ishizawai]